MVETAQTVKQKAGAEPENDKGPRNDDKKQVQSVEFSEAQENAASGATGSINILLDMNIPLTVTIGKTEIPVRRLLQLGPGSVIRLDKPIDAPVDLYMRGARFATGKIVVVDDRFAVRIEQILGPGKLNKEQA